MQHLSPLTPVPPQVGRQLAGDRTEWTSEEREERAEAAEEESEPAGVWAARGRVALNQATKTRTHH
jgi:hypothetical protein